MRQRILNMEDLCSHGNIKGRKIALEILEAGLQASDPYNATTELIKVKDGKIYIGNPVFSAEGDPQKYVTDVYEPGKDTDRIYFFGWGKGIQRVAKAVEDILGDFLTGGHVVCKHGDEMITEKCGVTFAGHPVPDKYCAEGCQKVVDICREANFGERDLVITGVGNGIGSLMTLPVDELSIDEVSEITRIIQIEKGGLTNDLNHIRSHVDKLKGGRINRYFGKARLAHIVVSTPNQPSPGQIALGHGYEAMLRGNRWLHTLSDISTKADAIAMMTKYDMAERLPNVTRYLKSRPKDEIGFSPEEFKARGIRMFGIVPPELMPVEASRKKAEDMGFKTHVLIKRLHCEAAPVGLYAGNIAILCETEKEPFTPPCVIICGGELIVNVGKSDGIGGRNQEFALSAAFAIRGNKKITIAAADSDGTDGPGGIFDRDAHIQGVDCLAGAVVDGYTFERVKNMDIDFYKMLSGHNTSGLLWRMKDGIVATHSMSLMDIHVIVVMNEDG